MTTRRHALLVALFGAVASACSASGASPAVDRPALADPFPDLVLGDLASFEVDTITEVDIPRHVFVTFVEGAPVVLLGKDPNIGCRLHLVDDELESTVDIPTGAAFWDACRGSSYDGRGRPLGAPDANAMWELDVVVRDGALVVPIGDAGPG